MASLTEHIGTPGDSIPMRKGTMGNCHFSLATLSGARQAASLARIARPRPGAVRLQAAGEFPYVERCNFPKTHV